MEIAFRKSVVAVIFAVMNVYLVQAESNLGFTTFTKGVACKLQNRLTLGLAELMPGNYSSLVKCAASCMDQCFGVNLDEDHKCYHHTTWPEATSCAENDVFFEMYHKNHCEHDGIWDTTRLKCKCVDGWVGVRCERYPSSCKELTTFGYPDGFHQATILQLNNYPTPFPVFCSYYKDKNEFYTYIFLNNGTYDNTMSWNDYVSGFFRDNTSYWIGLDKIKALNDAGHTAVYLRAVVTIDGAAKYPYYSFTNFRLGSASTGYNFTASSSIFNTDGTNYGDCLKPVVGVTFSTADHDNDQDGTNCAMSAKAGWWFKTCNVGCNPLGQKTYWKMTGLSLDRGPSSTYMYFGNA